MAVCLFCSSTSRTGCSLAVGGRNSPLVVKCDLTLEGRSWTELVIGGPSWSSAHSATGPALHRGRATHPGRLPKMLTQTLRGLERDRRAGSVRHREPLVLGGHDRSRPANESRRSHSIYRRDLGSGTSTGPGPSPPPAPWVPASPVAQGKSATLRHPPSSMIARAPTSRGSAWRTGCSTWPATASRRRPRQPTPRMGTSPRSAANRPAIGPSPRVHSGGPRAAEAGTKPSRVLRPPAQAPGRRRAGPSGRGHPSLRRAGSRGPARAHHQPRQPDQLVRGPSPRRIRPCLAAHARLQLRADGDPVPPGSDHGGQLQRHGPSAPSLRGTDYPQEARI